jgi:hypothetical protein
MIELDVAGLVVIAGQVLGIGTDAALSQLDIPAAEAALTEARLAGREAASAAARSRRPGSVPASPHRAAAGAAAVTLMHALLRHPPLPGHGEQVAAAAGLQFLAVNGWLADLDVPRAAAITIQGLASGQLTRPTPHPGWKPGCPRTPHHWTGRRPRKPCCRQDPGHGASCSPRSPPSGTATAPAPAPSPSASAQPTSPPASAPRPPG